MNVLVTRSSILVVDDERQILDIFVRALGGRHHVTRADNGHIAISRLVSNHDYDLIFLDLMLKDGPSGLEVIEQCITRAPARLHRTVIVTGAAGIPGIEEAVEHLRQRTGARLEMLEKPTSLGLLDQYVRKYTALSISRGPFKNGQDELGGASTVSSAAIDVLSDPRVQELLSRVESKMIEKISQVAQHRGPHRDSTRPPSHELESVIDDISDSPTGSHILVPKDLQGEVETILVKREKRAALELAAGRWAKLVQFIKDYGGKTLLALAGFAGLRGGEELVKLLIRLAHH